MINFQPILIQVKKFVLVGAISTGINYGVFFLVFKIFHFHYALGAVAGYMSGLIFGYIYNRKWTFWPTSYGRLQEIVLYITVYGFSLILNISLLNILVVLGKINPLPANVIAMAAAMCTNFLGLKYLVFNETIRGRIQNLLPLFSRAFWLIASFKLVIGSMFGSRIITEGFMPFINYFSASFLNPYSHFFNTANPAFPYPSGMLFALSLPYAFFHWAIPSGLAENLHIKLLLLRLPLLFFDILIYILLCKLLPTKEKKVLWLYFASPIVLYINYFHGQLDIVPTAILLLSLFLLIKQKFAWSFFVLGLGIATKTHILAVLPFYLLYMYRNRSPANQLLKFSLLACVAFILVNPYLTSGVFLDTVFNNPEQRRLLFLAVTFNFKDLQFFIAPAAIFLIFYKFAGYKKLNIDSLILILGLIFVCLVALVPPTQGWYFWALPFLIYFFIKYEKKPYAFGLWAINSFFILYFIFSQNSDVFSSLKPTFVSAENFFTPYQYLGSSGKILENLFFTGLETSLLVAALWNYRVGTQTTQQYQKKKERLILGIAGDSGVGKSTLALLFAKVFGDKNISMLHGDDVHKWERSDPRWKEFTHLHPKGNKIYTDLEHAKSLIKGEGIQRLSYDHANGQFIGPIEIKPGKFIIFQGLMPFILHEMRQLHDIKIYLEADENLRKLWKQQRDSTHRNRSLKEINQQIELRKPDAQKFIYPQKDFADWILSYQQTDQGIRAVHLFKNSVFLEKLYDELVQIPGLKVDHGFPDVNYQILSVEGDARAEILKETAYRLYPNLYDLLENEPEFTSGLNGVHQLLLINYLNHLIRLDE